MQSVYRLFSFPGWYCSLAGLFAVPAVMVAGYGTFDGVFGPNFLYTASLTALAGWHLIVFGFLAKLHSHLVESGVPGRDGWSGWPTSSGSSGGFSTAADFAGVARRRGPVLWHWVQTLAVPAPGLWLFAGTLFMLGVETVFLSFLVGILDLSREATRRG